MGPEARIQTKCVRWARDNGWWAAKFESPGTVGVPDFIFIKQGRVCFIEFKAPGKAASKIQLHTMQLMAKHGARVAIIDNFPAFEELLSAIA